MQCYTDCLIITVLVRLKIAPTVQSPVGATIKHIDQSSGVLIISTKSQNSENVSLLFSSKNCAGNVCEVMLTSREKIAPSANTSVMVNRSKFTISSSAHFSCKCDRNKCGCLGDAPDCYWFCSVYCFFQGKLCG